VLAMLFLILMQLQAQREIWIHSVHITTIFGILYVSWFLISDIDKEP
jgi:hypothetical protein